MEKNIFNWKWETKSDWNERRQCSKLKSRNIRSAVFWYGFVVSFLSGQFLLCLACCYLPVWRSWQVDGIVACFAKDANWSCHGFSVLWNNFLFCVPWIGRCDMIMSVWILFFSKLLKILTCFCDTLLQNVYDVFILYCFDINWKSTRWWNIELYFFLLQLSGIIVYKFRYLLLRHYKNGYIIYLRVILQPFKYLKM